MASRPSTVRHACSSARSAALAPAGGAGSPAATSSAALSGGGSAARSTLPLRFSGSTGNSTKCAGTM